MIPEQRQYIIEDFIQFVKERLDIDQLPTIRFLNDREWATERRSFGEYNPNKNHLDVYIGNRNLADILRTLGHELVHHRQNELGKLYNSAGKTGSNIENQANALAGIMMRDYGKTNDLIYESFLPTLKQIYEVEQKGGIQIYCDMDGVLCDFDERFVYYYPDYKSPLEYRLKNGSDALKNAVDRAGVDFWSKMKWMPGGSDLWSIIGKYNPYILTSPGDFEYAKEGKKLWIESNLDPQPKEIIFAQTGNKHSEMKTNPDKSILIDDYWPNLAPWKTLGGIAVMHKDINKTKDILSKFRINEVKYSKPNFNVEWEEAIRYPELKKIGKDNWEKISKKGYVTKYSKIKNVLGNVDLNFNSLEKEKKQRFQSAFKKGQIEMPIAVKFSDSDYDLLAGNTRLSGLVNNGEDPNIWIVDISKLYEVSYPSLKYDIVRDEEDNSVISVDYTFKTKENNYRVEISSMEKAGDFEVSFGLHTGNFNKIDTFQMTGEGDAKNILETVSNIINKFYYEYKKYINKIIIKGTSEKRSRIYKEILPKYIDPEVLQKIEIK